MSEQVLYEVSQGVARIVLNRPDHGNALDPALEGALAEAVDRVAGTRPSAPSSSPAPGRCSAQAATSPPWRRPARSLDAWIDRMAGSLGAVTLALARLPVPVVSALNGPVAGGGIGLALCADVVLAAESMKLRGGYSGIGFTADLGASWFLAHRVGPARAKEILFLNRPLAARECLERGLVNAVHPDDRLAAEADALVRRLADGATLALARAKRLVDGALARSLEDHLALERESMILSARTQDGREGIAAFVEKRAPRFKGR